MRSTRVSWACLAVCVSSLLAMGCDGGPEKGPTGEVEGTVTMDGQPLTEGGVSFYHPETGGSGGAGLDASGKFKFESPVAVGTYQVSFQPPEPPPPDDVASGQLPSANDTFPDAYQDESRSGIVAEVKQGPNSFEFKLTKSGPSDTDAGGEMPPQ